MTESRIKQFKLTNNDEIICEVVEWHDEKDHDASIVVRSCMKVILMEDFSRGVRFYAFRPWFTFDHDPSTLQILNASHVLGEANPSIELLKHYAKSILTVKENKKSGSKIDLNMDSVAEKLETLNDDQFERFMTDVIYGDSDEPSNIITFPKGKLH
tara:strand:- start:139 stop:606 length:468 start_codon:yes stop_codon:yes gene_type:complete